jgi:hypothetical protein
MLTKSDNSCEPSARRGRGWLRHGNPPADLADVPHCGARTRAGGCCRQPAMKNGRCRFHGGKSTGPRTPEGLARSRAARYVHGFRSAEAIAVKRDARAAVRRLGVLIAWERLVRKAETLANRAMNPMSGEGVAGCSPSEECREPPNRAMDPMSGESLAGRWPAGRADTAA